MLMQREAKKNGGKKGTNAQASKSRKQGEWLPKQPHRDRIMKFVVRTVDRPVYMDAESDSWIGCNTCEMWWHYWSQAFSQCYLRRVNGFVNTVSHTKFSSSLILPHPSSIYQLLTY